MADPNRTVLTESDITDPGPLRTALAAARGDGTVSWSNVTGKPSNFPPSAHAASHAAGGSDVITPESIGAQPALSGSISYLTQSGALQKVDYTPEFFPLVLTFAMSDQAAGTQKVNQKIDDLIKKSHVKVLTNPTTIPTDSAKRLDLVFTEPTTVSFGRVRRWIGADPDAHSSGTVDNTDLVLSIEGWEHITWEGVVIHGTPNVTGVVWASALFRLHDSTWHLLVEQDTSVAGGGNVRLHQWTTPLEAVRDKSPQVLDSRGFVEQEAYEPFPLDLTCGDVVVDLDNPAGGAPIVSYVNVPLRSGASALPAAFTPVSGEAVFRTPDDSSYFKFAVTDCKIRGDIYVLKYTVKIKGSPFRADTPEQFDHPMLASLVAPGCGSFVLVDYFDIPGFSPPGSGRPSLTISRPQDPASQAPYVRVAVPATPATSFATEVTVTRSIEGHIGGSGRSWSET